MNGLGEKNDDVMEHDGVVIKEEHAYASNEASNMNENVESSDEDPLRIMPCDMNKIKTENDSDHIENVEIKVEPDFSLEDNSEMLFSECNENVNGAFTENIQLPENPYSVESIHFVNEVVPKSAYMDLQNKYNVMCSKFMTQKRRSPNSKDVERFDKKKVIANMKEIKNDLRGAKMVGNKLKFEINMLAKQNLFLRKKLKECASGRYERIMERSINNLHKRVQNFVMREKQDYSHIKNMASRIEYKEYEQKFLESRLRNVISKLDFLKQKVLEATSLKSMLNDTKTEKEKLQKELADCMKVRYLYEDHADLIKRELNTKITEKEGEVEKYKKEAEKMSKMCEQLHNSGMVLKEKFKIKYQALENKYCDVGRLLGVEKEKSKSLQDKLLQEHSENAILKQYIQEIEKELGNYKKANLEDKLAEKRQENVMLREEIAILKIELEKCLLKIKP